MLNKYQYSIGPVLVSGLKKMDQLPYYFWCKNQHFWLFVFVVSSISAAIFKQTFKELQFLALLHKLHIFLNWVFFAY